MRYSIRTFYILMGTQVISMIGSQMSSFAIGIKVFNDTGQATPLAVVAFLATIPRILGANVAGLLADRLDRKRLMIVSDTGQAIATALLMISFLSGEFVLWHLYAATLLSSFFGVFQGPAFMAVVTVLVPDEERDRANTVQQMAGPSASIIAPIVAGALYGVVGVVGIMILDLLTFGVAVTALYSVHIPRPPQTEEGQASRGGMLREALSGFQFLLERRMLFYLILYATLLNFLFNMAGVLNTPYILSLTGSETILALVTSAMGVGPLLGGILFSLWRRRISRMSVIFAGITTSGLGLVAFGVARSPLLLAASAFFILLLNPAVNASLMSLLQIKTPPDLQGRVFAAVMQLAILATPLGNILAGPLADQLLEPAVGTSAWATVTPLVGARPGAGIGLLMVINGGLVVGVSLALWRIKAMRQLEARLPDYKPLAEPEETAPMPSPAVPA